VAKCRLPLQLHSYHFVRRVLTQTSQPADAPWLDCAVRSMWHMASCCLCVMGLTCCHYKPLLLRRRECVSWIIVRIAHLNIQAAPNFLLPAARLPCAESRLATGLPLDIELQPRSPRPRIVLQPYVNPDVSRRLRTAGSRTRRDEFFCCSSC
jgi:hypothetical protein